MALNRLVYDDIPHVPKRGVPKPPGPHPYKARYRHQYWFIDGRMMDFALEGSQVVEYRDAGGLFAYDAGEGTGRVLPALCGALVFHPSPLPAPAPPCRRPRVSMWRTIRYDVYLFP